MTLSRDIPLNSNESSNVLLNNIYLNRFIVFYVSSYIYNWCRPWAKNNLWKMAREDPHRSNQLKGIESGKCLIRALWSCYMPNLMQYHILGSFILRGSICLYNILVLSRCVGKKSLGAIIRRHNLQLRVKIVDHLNKRSMAQLKVLITATLRL